MRSFREIGENVFISEKEEEEKKVWSLDQMIKLYSLDFINVFVWTQLIDNYSLICT